ncbi:hypothetical protein TWF788_000979 [Orbilia oligospora]|uniref:Uncharacterized protein n=1 Tax=Orbilia oligospora TaxID=2813651 RepID=A0A7C8Q175_ORBOL|nr:hypothetical protein TWF788_000979 [Orbilia oligospora]
MQLTSVFAVVAVVLSPLVSAAVYKCPATQYTEYYCCASSGPLSNSDLAKLLAKAHTNTQPAAPAPDTTAFSHPWPILAPAHQSIPALASLEATWPESWKITPGGRRGEALIVDKDHVKL